ncbi:MAG: hypothetical protein AMXMBFR42_18530 [Burkholderiales bacterium]
MIVFDGQVRSARATGANGRYLRLGCGFMATFLGARGGASWTTIRRSGWDGDGAGLGREGEGYLRAGRRSSRPGRRSASAIGRRSDATGRAMEVLLMGFTLPDFPHRRKRRPSAAQAPGGGVRRRRNSDQPDTTKPEIA